VDNHTNPRRKDPAVTTLTLTADNLVETLKDAWRQPGASRPTYGTRPFQPIALSDQDQPIPPGTQNPLWDVVRWMPASPPWYDGTLLEPEFYAAGLSDLKRFDDLGIGRMKLSSRYAWSIITPGDVTWIVQQLAGRPVVEIGAGSGYWAWQLEQAGVDIAAYDPHPVSLDNEFCKHGPYTAVLPGGPEAVLSQHPDRALLMVWPPYGGAHAAEALRLYCGDLLIYAGEGWGGCTADDGFYELLDQEWNEVSEAPQHVTWSGVHCSLRAYRRKIDGEG
jgi:hypothetical protein